MNEMQLNWYPIASSSDLEPRHVFDAQLLGQEIAAWRADDGYANVWENRCLHRGVRLSIGINDGKELKCQYHGWRYSNRSASCTYIPAHPADAPARTVCNKRYPSQEKYGLVWTGLTPAGDLPTFEVLEDVPTQVLRSIPVNARSELVKEWLPLCKFDTAETPGWNNLTSFEVSSGAVVFTCEENRALVFLVQPVDAQRSVIRGIAAGIDQDSLADLRHLNACLTELRTKIEAAENEQPDLPQLKRNYARVNAELATMPDRVGTAGGRSVRVLSKTMSGADVVRIELEAVEGDLPTGQAGSHLDVHLPNGLTRQYSLTNGPAETTNYIIGVKREPDSKGGSECLHETVREGDLLSVSPPRNNFPLRRDALRSVFVAGGIGITPLLSMAKTIENQGLDYELHYFVRDDDHVAFREQLDAMKGKVNIHLGQSPEQTSQTLHHIYSNPGDANHTYICGPGPMLEAAREAAAECGWDEGEVHFEYFKNSNEVDDSSSFDIALARSGRTLRVNAGETILDVLKSNGIAIASSCCQGACGTCKVAVIEGEVDHQDVHLTETEKRENAYVMTCVSRAISDRLVLDI